MNYDKFMELLDPKTRSVLERELKLKPKLEPLGLAHTETRPSKTPLTNVYDPEIYEAMSLAIANLAPDGDYINRLDRRQLFEKVRLDKMRLTSVKAINDWFDGWRILFAELLIDEISI